MLIRMELPHLYEVRRLEELSAPASLPLLHFSPGNSPGNGEHLLLEFTPPTSAAWIGSFACGISSGTALTMVLSSPDPLIAFVVAGGIGYSVHVNSPEQCQLLPVSPVMFVEVLSQEGMAVLGSGNALAVYDAKGLVWFKRVVESDLKLQSISEGLIHFSGLDTEAGQPVRLSAELGSGRKVG